MIVVLEQKAGLRLRRVTVKDRISARLRAAALDRQLATGVPPEASATLALHAAHLCQPAQRGLLARSLSRIAEASDERHRSRTRVPVSRTAIGEARGELTAVVARLVAGGPVDVQGVARIRTLLADGGGPLYRSGGNRQLRSELRAALIALDASA